MSLAAVPVYLLARHLRLGTGYSLACAVYALAIPDLGFSAFILSDPLAYPLALSAALHGRRRARALGSAVPGGVRRLRRAGDARPGRVRRPRPRVRGRGNRPRPPRRRPRPAASAGAVRRRRPALVAMGPAGCSASTARSGSSSLDRSAVRLGRARLRSCSGSLPESCSFPGASRVSSLARGRPGAVVLSTSFCRSRLSSWRETALYASNGAEPLSRALPLRLLPLVPSPSACSRGTVRAAAAGRLRAGGICLQRRPPSRSRPISAGRRVRAHSPLLWAFVELERSLGEGDRLPAPSRSLRRGSRHWLAAVAWTRYHARPRSRSQSFSLGSALARRDASTTSSTRAQFAAAWSRRTRPGSTTPALGPCRRSRRSSRPSSLRAAVLEHLRQPRARSSAAAETPTDVFAFGTLGLREGRRSRSTAGGRLRTAFSCSGFAGIGPLLRRQAVPGPYSSFSLWRPAGKPRLTTSSSAATGTAGWLPGHLEIFPPLPKPDTVSFTLSLPRSAPSPVTMRFGRSSVSRLGPARSPCEHSREPFSALSTPFGASSRRRPCCADRRFASVRSTVPLFTPSGA